MPARTKMILAISDMLRKEGVLYTMPPMAKIDGQRREYDLEGEAAPSDMGLVGQMGVYSMMPNVTTMTAA